MKIKKNLFTVLFILLLVFLYSGCGDDSTTTPPPAGTGYPNVDIKLNAKYFYNNFVIDTSGNLISTDTTTENTVQSKGTYFGENDAYMITSITKDGTLPIPIALDTFYVKYNASSGKFYHYGAVNFFDPTQTPKWDIIADFSQTPGTSWPIASNIPIPGVPGATANITAKVVVDTTFNSTATPPVSIKAWRIEMTAVVSISTIQLGNVIVDYFLGYTPSTATSNPSGMVRIRLRPIKLQFTASRPGADQILNNVQY